MMNINILQTSLLPECSHIYLANDFFVFMQELFTITQSNGIWAVLESHHIEPRQLGILNVVSDFISAELSGSSLMSIVPILQAKEWAPHLPWLNPLDSVWDILQELVYKGLCELYADLHELEKVVRQKWNEIDEQDIKKATLQWQRRLAVVTKQDG